MINDFKPLRDCVLLGIRDDQEEKRGGLYIPQVHDMDKDKRQLRCDVLAVGPKSELQVGQVALIVEYGGRTRLEYQGKKCILARDCDISGIVDS